MAKVGARVRPDRVQGRRHFDPEWMRAYQRRLLYGGGAVLALLMLFCAAAVAWVELNDYQAARRADFLTGKARLLTSMSENSAVLKRLAVAGASRWDARARPSSALEAEFVAQHGFLLHEQPTAQRAYAAVGTPGPGFCQRPLLALSERLLGRGVARDPERLGPDQIYVIGIDCPYAATLLRTGQDAMPPRERFAQLPSAWPRAWPDVAAMVRDAAVHPERLADDAIWLPPRQDPVTSEVQLRIAHWVLDGQDRPVALMVYGIRPERFLNGLEDGQHGGEFAVIDQAQRVLLTPTGARSAEVERAARALPRQQSASLEQRALDGRVVLREAIPQAGWELIYVYSTAALLHGLAPRLIAIAALLLCGLAILCGGIVLIHRGILAPSYLRAARLQESERLNRTLIRTAPVGLALIDAGDGSILLRNDVMARYEGRAAGQALAQRIWQLFARAPGAGAGPRARALVGRELMVADGNAEPTHLQVDIAPVRFRGVHALLSTVTDITARKQTEQSLHEARQAADQANKAKSVFLATMSHEIRTPLYGVVSTLELLGLTPLDARQQGYLQTIRSSSHILLQLISDILDVSKIEAGQMPLDAEPFSPLDVSEEVLRTYAARAREKGPQLYGCFAADLPAEVVGDGMRIRQILGNLVSNAIKFTRAGHVVLRLTATSQESAGDASGRAALRWEVADSGPGLSRAQQARLFEPFYQVETDGLHAGGTGLGLSICWRLSRMMGGTLDVASAPGEGSRFAFGVALDLPRPAPCPAASAPLVEGPIHVRAPAPELAASVCRWLQTLGCHAEAVPAGEGGPGAQAGVLLDLLPEWLPPLAWAGPRVLATPDAVLQPQRTAEGWRVDLHSRAGIMRALAVATGLEHGVGVADGEAPVPAWRALGLRVLVAEDNPVNRALLQAQLEQLGCTVTAAPDGEAALRCWREQAFDVVLTDVNMPVMDGYALTRALRARDAALPIIGVTANAMREEGERCLAAGMDAWLTKPMSLQALYAKLERAAGGRGRGVGRLEEHVPSAGAQAAASPAAAAAAAGSTPPAEPTGDPMADSLVVPDPLRALFLSTMREDLAATHAAIERGDAAQVRAQLHRMRGALAVAHGEALVAACRELERAQPAGAPLGDGEALRKLLARIEAAAARV